MAMKAHWLRTRGCEEVTEIVAVRFSRKIAVCQWRGEEVDKNRLWRGDVAGGKVHRVYTRVFDFIPDTMALR